MMKKLSEVIYFPWKLFFPFSPETAATEKLAIILTTELKLFDSQIVLAKFCFFFFKCFNNYNVGMIKNEV